MKNRIYTIILMILIIIIEGLLIAYQSNAINKLTNIISDKNNTIEVLNNYANK